MSEYESKFLLCFLAKNLISNTIFWGRHKPQQNGVDDNKH